MALQLVTRSAEVKLMETLHDMRDAPRWKAVHFHLGRLLEQYQSEYQVKIATNLIHDLLKDHDGGIFLLVDHGIIVLCSGMEKNLQSKLIFQLRYLYMDDPLAYTDDGQENLEFCDSYDLANQWQEFSDLVAKKMARSVRKIQTVERPEPKPVIEPPAPAVKNTHLSAVNLAAIEKDLGKTDLSKALRRQPVCAAQPGAKVRRVFDEIYIHIAHLRQTMKAEIDFFSNRWLFKYLTQLLDQRMIELIRQNPSHFLSSPISLNLNVETLLSSWFSDFDAAISPSSKVSVVIEVPVVDAFADLSAFMLARDEVQKLGYRLCLDGLTTQSFTQIDRGKLGADLVKVQWNADMQSDLHTSQNQRLADAIQMAGTNRVILCRCDNRQAVEYGQALGIPLFQGRYIDTLVNPTALIEN